MTRSFTFSTSCVGSYFPQTYGVYGMQVYELRPALLDAYQIGAFEFIKLTPDQNALCPVSAIELSDEVISAKTIALLTEVNTGMARAMDEVKEKKGQMSDNEIDILFKGQYLAWKFIICITLIEIVLLIAVVIIGLR